MAGAIDPHLLAQVAEAGDDGEVEAVVLIADDAQRAGAPGEAATGTRLISRVAEQVNEQPAEVQHMPLLGTLFVRGSGRFVRQLLQADEAVAASANDAEITRAQAGP